MWLVYLPLAPYEILLNFAIVTLLLMLNWFFWVLFSSVRLRTLAICTAPRMCMATLAVAFSQQRHSKRVRQVLSHYFLPFLLPILLSLLDVTIDFFCSPKFVD